MKPPQQHPILIRLAHALLAKAERSQGDKATILRLDDDRVLPELMQASNPDELAHLGLLLDGLCATAWVRLQARKAQPFQTLADRQPALVLLNGTALAAWSGFEPTPPRWSRLLVEALRLPGVLNVPDATALLDYLLRSPLPCFEDLAPADCARVLNELAAACTSAEVLYLRELSARHFRGHSKVLDTREELLRLLGASEGQFPEAPIQLLVGLPVSGQAGVPFNEVLFIENLVSFERMCAHRHPVWQHAALVFASGFKGAARRLRTPVGSSLYWQGIPCPQAVEAFARCVYGNDDPANAHMPIGFYGDLDFAGMQILAQLRQSFPTCTAWQPGYAALASLIAQGEGHSPALADKEGQLDPGHTGCIHADTCLLPLLRQSQRCLDQERWPAATALERQS